MVGSEFSVNRYDIYNVAGVLILSKPVDEKSFEINVSELTAGTYFIKIASEGMVQTKRFVKR